MFNKLKDKMIERELNKIEKILHKIDYGELRHNLMKMKWEALRLKDDDAYQAIEDYEKIAKVLEEVFGGNRELCQ